MIVIENVEDINKTIRTVTIPSDEERTIDGTGLTLLPALIDPHVHFRTPGAEYKEDWKSGAEAAIAGGVTTVFDMPNTFPPCTTKARLLAKRETIDNQLEAIGIPLRYHLYLGASKEHLDEIETAQREAVAIKVFMGSSTGTLLVDTEEVLSSVFEKAAATNQVVALHAEKESILKKYFESYRGSLEPSAHSIIRDREAAIEAVGQALHLCGKYQTKTYILHVSTKEELELIREAKKQYPRLVFCETTPHHLFLNSSAYQDLGCMALVNPPLRSQEDNNALWEAILDGTIDAVGSDHAPHTREEKNLPYGQAPSGVPGVETTLPLLLDAVSKGKITLEQIVALCRTNIEAFFQLPSHDDVVLVDRNRKAFVESRNLKTKCGWSPYEGWELQGWPVYTIIKGKVFSHAIQQYTLV